jgi:hypothetical protein
MLRSFGWTRSARHEVTSCITDLVSDVGGFVLESQRFSNKALMLRIQVPARRCVELASSIASCAVNLDGQSVAAIEQYVKGEPGTEGVITGTLHMGFVHDEPDLRTETSAVPG